MSAYLNGATDWSHQVDSRLKNLETESKLFWQENGRLEAAVKRITDSVALSQKTTHEELSSLREFIAEQLAPLKKRATRRKKPKKRRK